MTEVLKSRISDEFVDLIANHPEYREYFQSLQDVRKKQGLNLGVMLTDPHARTETRKLDNGDLEVVFTFPLDNNYDREDGRLWVIDRYVFDAKDRTFNKVYFDRKVEYNNLGANKAQWREWRDIVQKNATVADKDAAEFAKGVIHSYSRPFLDNHIEAMKKVHAAEKKAAEEGKQDYPAYMTPLHVALWKKSGLLVKFSDPRNHITRVERDNAYDIILSYVVDDDDPETKGHLWVQDKFTFFESDQPIHASRKITVAKGSPQNEGWEEARRLFYGPDGKTLSEDMVLSMDAAQKYISFFPKEAFSKTPDFTAIAVKDAGSQAEEPKEELTLAKFEAAFEKKIEKKTSVDLSKIDPEMAQALQGNIPYFETLKRNLAPDFQWDWQSIQVKTKVEVRGDKTQVKFLYIFGDSTLDGVDRGQLTFTENFNFKGKELQEIERSINREGPDPEGKLTATMERLQKALTENEFPKMEDPTTQAWIQAVLPRMAPQLVEFPGRVPVLEDPNYPLSEEKAQNLRALKDIQDKLIPFLHQPGMDPKFRVRLLGALKAFQYDDPTTAIQLLMGAGQAPGKEPPVQNKDFDLINNIVFSLSIGLTHEAITQVDHFESPRIKEIFEGALKPIQRKQLNQEGLTLMSKMVSNQIQLREYESTKWFGGEDFDEKAAQTLAEGLFTKAAERAKKFPDANPFAVLRNLEGLSEAEGTLRDNILKDPLFKTVNSIAQETDSEIQGKDYYNFAHTTLMEAKLGGAAAYLAKFVALHKMPLTSSLTSLKVLEKFSEDELKKKLNDRMESKIGEKEKWLKLILDPTEMQKLPEAEQKSIMDKLFSSYGEKLNELQMQLVKENPQFGVLMMQLVTGENLFNKAFNQIGSQPDTDIETLINGLQGLDEMETQFRQEILTQPLVKKILAANKIPETEERYKKYSELFQELSQDPTTAPLVEQLRPYIEQGQFPQGRGVEGAFLLSHFILTPIREYQFNVTKEMLAQVMAPDIEAERKEAMAGLQKDLAIEQAAYHELVEKARALAASRPTENPVEILKSITDASLDQELADLRAKWPVPDADQKTTLDYMDKLYAAMKVAREELIQNPLVQEVGALAVVENPFDRRDGYKKIFTRIQSRAALAPQLMVLGQIPDAAKRKEAAKSLSETEGLSEATKKNILVLGETEDPDVFQKTFEEVSKSPDFKENAYLESVISLSTQLEMGQLVTASRHEAVRYAPGVSDEDKQKQLAQMGPEDNTAKDLQKFLAYAEGRGDLGTKLEYMSPVIMDELTKPTSLAAMALAGYVGPVAEGLGLGLVSKLGFTSRGALVAANGLAITGGIAVEGATFTTAAKLGESSFYGSAHQWDHYGRDVGTSILTFGALRLGHFGAGKISEQLFATGRLGKWFGGPARAGELGTTVNPMGRIAVGRPLADGTVPTLTRAGQKATWALNHGTALGSMYLSHDMAKWLGWAKEHPQGAAGQWADTLIMYLQATAMFGIINSATGGRYQSRIAEMRFGNQMKLDLPKLQNAKPGKGVPVLVDRGTVEEFTIKTRPVDEATIRSWFADELGIHDADAIKFRFKDGKMELSDTRTIVVEGETILIDGKAVTRDRVSEKAAGEGRTVSVDGAEFQGEYKDNHKVELDAWVSFTPENTITTKNGKKLTGYAEYVAQRQAGVLPQLKALEVLPHVEQLTLSRKLDSAKNTSGLLKSLDRVPGEGGPLISRWVGEVMAGTRDVETLPTSLNIRANVERLMSKEVEEFHHMGWTRENFELGERLPGQEVFGLQKEYVVGVLAQGMAKRISIATSKQEILEILAKSPFKEIDGLSLDAWAEAVAKGELDSGALGIRQRIKDLTTQTPPDKAEAHLVKTLVERHLDQRQGETYEKAQDALRKQIDNLTPEIKVLFLKGYLQGPRAKRQKALLDAYFGPEGSREMPSAGRGHEIATLFGRAGLSESVTLVEKTNAHGRSEWHLVRGDSTEGWPLVKTRANQPGEKLSVDSMFYSVEELKDLLPKMLQQAQSNSGPIARKVDPKEVRTVIMHPWGASEYRFKPKTDAEGNPTGEYSLDVRYSLRAGKGGQLKAAEARVHTLREKDWKPSEDKEPWDEKTYIVDLAPEPKLRKIWLDQGVTEVNIYRVPKFKEFLKDLEYRNGMPNLWQRISGSRPAMPVKPHWLKMPEISLRRGKKGAEKSEPAPEPSAEGEGAEPPAPKKKSKAKTKAKAKSKAEKNVKGSEKSEPAEPEAPAETSEPAKKERDPKPDSDPEMELSADDLEIIPDSIPPGPEITPAPREPSPSTTDPNLSRINHEAASRVQENLRIKFEKKSQEVEEVPDGEVIEITLNAGEATMKPSHMGRVISLKYQYNKDTLTFELLDKSARDLENARSHNDDPEIDSFYEGILNYPEVSLGLF